MVINVGIENSLLAYFWYFNIVDSLNDDLNKDEVENFLYKSFLTFWMNNLIETNYFTGL